METTLSPSSVVLYWNYISSHCPDLPPDLLAHLAVDLSQTNWEEPETSLDCNNIAVMALIEAESCEDMTLRSMSLELALEALTQGAEIEPSHPLCHAHLALTHSLLGDSEIAFRIAFPALLDLLHYAYNATESLPTGLVYLPFYQLKGSLSRPETLVNILRAEEGYMQAERLLAEVLNQAQLVFYNAPGKRMLQMAAQLTPDAAGLNLKLGLTQLMQQQWEGLLNLQHARAVAPEFAPAVQALHLAYRGLQPAIAAYWLEYGRECARTYPDDLAWQWTNLETDSLFTYVPFERSLLMAVDPSLNSIVTSILLAEADWFEAEIEFWRHQLQPGMTVIDVGANVGVYTFSAAQQVGETGQVLAVEPFSGCVRCLQETQRLNELNWVKVCAGAASDRHSKARLSLRAASELNEIVTDTATATEGNFEEVACFPLDSLIEQEGLTHIDWLKIDAEGHEMQVLAGSERILKEFKPGIIYENIAGASASNTPVAEYLQANGYQLFRYQPYLRNLIPVHSIEELQDNLNVIALPVDES